MTDLTQVPVKELAPYQQRVVAEKAELDEKLKALGAFLDSDASKSVPNRELSLLISQGGAMHNLSIILRERIAMFNADSLPDAVDETTSAPSTEDTPPESLIEIKDIDALAGMVLNWHSKALSDINNLMEIPEGTTVELKSANPEDKTLVTDESVELTGVAHAAFRCGVFTSLAIMDTLPFSSME